MRKDKIKKTNNKKSISKITTIERAKKENDKSKNIKTKKNTISKTSKKNSCLQ